MMGYMNLLLHQAGKKHVTDSFRPDPHSSLFARPGRREMNDGIHVYSIYNT